MERHARQRNAAVAHRAKNEPDAQGLELGGGLGLKRPAGAGLEPVPDQAHRGHLARGVADELDGGDEEADDQRLRLARARPVRVLLQDLDLLERGAILALFDSGAAQLVQLDLLRPRDDVGDGQLAHLVDLGIGERRLHGAAPPEQVHLLDPALAQGLERIVGDVGRGQLFRRPAEHARHVDGHVADADHGRALLREIELTVSVVGVAVVPGDELGGRMAPLEILAGNPHAPVGLGAGGVDDLVVVPAEIGHRDVLAQLDAAVKAEPRVGRDLVEGGGDGLDLLMVGGDAGAHQPVGGRQAVDHVDLDHAAVLLQQMVGRVVAGRAGADDGNSQRLSLGSWLGH